MNSPMDKDFVSRCSWQALIIAALALSIFPETLASSYWLGKTWLWLMTTPICILLVIHRYRFAAAWQTALVNSPSRRRGQSSSVQARRKRFGKSNIRRNPQRAAQKTLKPMTFVIRALGRQRVSLSGLV